MSSEELSRLVAEARARYDALTPDEKAWHDHEQRRSFVRGQCPSDRDYEKWCADVDRLLPPLPRPRPEKPDDGGHTYLYERVVRVTHNGVACRVWMSMNGDFSSLSLKDTMESVLVHGRGTTMDRAKELAGIAAVNSVEIVDETGFGVCVHKDWP